LNIGFVLDGHLIELTCYTRSFLIIMLHRITRSIL